MASFTRHKSGWRAHVMRNGYRQSKVFDTKREAQAWAAKTEAKLSDMKRAGHAFGAAVSRFRKDELPRLKAQAWTENALARLLDQVGGDTSLGAIDQPFINAWKNQRLKTVSGSTVQREANLLRRILRLARLEWHWMSEDPFSGVRLPKHNEPRHQLWTWQLIRRVLRAKREGKTAEMQLAFHIALRTGMRLSEVLAAPSGFDAKRRVVVLQSTKTTGRAEVPIGRIAAKLLAGASFTVGPNEGSTLFSKLTRELLIEGLTFHDARATALTHLSRKVDVMVLAKISRHRDLRILQRVYYRVGADEIARMI